MLFTRRATILATLLALAPLSVGATEPLAAPEGPVLLRVTGEITQTNDGDAAVFDLSMLQALGVREVTTSTIWTDGVNTFSGVSLSDVMQAVGATGQTISATAINNYAVDIPMSDATDTGPIIAYAMDGTALTRRNKGPLWVIYPYDQGSQFRNEVIYTRSIWQLDRLDLVD